MIVIEEEDETVASSAYVSNNLTKVWFLDVYTVVMMDRAKE